MKQKSALLIFVLFIASLTWISHSPFVKAFPTGIDCDSGNAAESGSGNVHIITFTATDNETDANCVFIIPNNVYAIDYLVVAGGGGGNSGGGGAGGLVTSWPVQNQNGTSVLAQRGSPMTVYPGSRIPIIVGVGGQGGSGGAYDPLGVASNLLRNQFPIGTSGHNSRFGGVIATGGGRGGYGFGCQGGSAEPCPDGDMSGAPGGSGGGAAYDFQGLNNSLGSSSLVVGATTLGNGGGAAGNGAGYRAGSGGGGAGTIGLGATQLHIGGQGGQGVLVDISGNSTVYACGGGGGVNENYGPQFARYGPFSNGVNSFESSWQIGIFEELNYVDRYGYEYFEDGNYWFYDSYADTFIDPVENVYSHVPDTNDFVFTDDDEFSTTYTITATPVVLWQEGVLTGRYIDGNNNYWEFSFENSSWTNVTTNAVWQRPINGGGPGGCLNAGSGSSFTVHPNGGASPSSNATSGLNDFGHGGGGTDPESTVAGRGGNGVVIIRYITEDPNCPNNGQNNPDTNSYPIACIAKLKITAGVVSNESRSIRSVAVLDSPVSYSQPGDSVSLITSISGLEVSIWENRVLAQVTSTASPLIGGTYPIMYRITSGANTSESFVLITVRDPAQRTQTRVPVDPRDSSVVLPKIILGQVNALQLCVSPRPSSDYPILPRVELIQNPGNVTFDSPSGKNLRMVGNPASISTNIQLIQLTSEQQRLILNGKSIELDVNVSNTEVGGNGSCEFGTDSTMTIYPLKLTQVRSFTLLPKNGRENN